MDSEHELDASILEAITNVEDYYKNPYIVDVNKRIALGKENFYLTLVLDGASRKNREARSRVQKHIVKKKFNLKRCFIRKLHQNKENRIVHFEEPEEKLCPLFKSLFKLKF